MSVTVGEIRREWRTRAANYSIDMREVDLLIATALGRSTTWVFAHDDHQVSDALRSQIDAMLVRRFEGEPTQYVRGFTEFYGRRFIADDRALIPRPETEMVVENTLRRVSGASRVLDIGTGTGCIAITIALELPEADVTAIDISVDALALARRNARELGGRVRFIASDVFDALDGSWDAVVGNPPYIPGHEMDGLQKEIFNFEPHLALTPGTAGTEIILRMLRDGHRIVRPGGLMVFEIGWKQGETVGSLATAEGWLLETIEDDLGGIPRCVILRKP